MKKGLDILGTVDFFWKLVTDPTSYRAFLSFTNWQLLGFLLASSVILGTVWFATIARHLIPELRQQLNSALNELDANYPTDLVISWSGSELSTVPTKEYLLSFPRSVSPAELGLPEYLLLLDTNPVASDSALTSLSSSGSASLSALLSVSASELRYLDQNKTTTVLNLQELLPSTPFVKSKTEVINYLNATFNSDAAWQKLGLAAAVFALPSQVLSTLLSWLTQWLLAYLVLIKISGVKLTGIALARLCLPVVQLAKLIELLAQLIYNSNQQTLFSVTFWLVLFLVTRAVFTKAKLQVDGR